MKLSEYIDEMNVNGQLDYADYNNLRDMADELEAENADLHARLDKAVELPSVKRDCELTQIVYRNNYGNIEVETYFHDCYYGECHDVRGDVHAEARLAELKGEGEGE